MTGASLAFLLVWIFLMGIFGGVFLSVVWNWDDA